MRLTILGSSPAAPNPGEACAGYLVQQDNASLLLDCGHGIASRLQTAIDVPSLSAILISHMHPDHFFDLVPLAYVYSFNAIPPVPLWLPPDGREILRRLEEAIGLEADFFEDAYDVQEYDPQFPIEVAGLQVSFAPTRHFIPCWAARFTLGNTNLVYTADTAWTDSVVNLAQGCDVALVESTLLEYTHDHDRDGHLTAALAGELAQQAGAHELVLTHYPSSLGSELLQAARGVYSGRVSLAEPGAVFTTGQLHHQL